MSKRNGPSTAASTLESDEVEFRRTTPRMQQQPRPTGHDPVSGRPRSSGRGVTVADCAPPKTQQSYPKGFTDTDFSRSGDGIRYDGRSSTGLGLTTTRDQLGQFHDRYQSPISAGKAEEGRLDIGPRTGMGHRGSGREEIAVLQPVDVTVEPIATTDFRKPLQTQEIETVREEISVQRSSFPSSFSIELDNLQDAELYAPPSSQPLTSGQFFPSAHWIPDFVMDQTLSSSSSRNSYHSLSSPSSFSHSASPGVDGGVVASAPQMEELDMVHMATDIASIRLDDMEMDGAEMAANQCEEIYEIDPETIELANQLRRLFQQNDDGDTILHQMIICRVNESTIMPMIRLFRKYDLLNVPNDLQQTPLHLATITCQDDVIAHLLQNGVRRKVFDRNLDTPLHIACRQGHVGRVKALHPAQAGKELEQELRDVVESSNKEGQTCLHVAALGNPNTPNQLDIVRYLIEDCKINVNLKELRRGRTILHLAVERRNLELVNYLLNLPASFELLVDDLTYDGYSALQMAQIMNQSRMEELFQLAGAQPIMDVDAN